MKKGVNVLALVVVLVIIGGVFGSAASADSTKIISDNPFKSATDSLTSEIPNFTKNETNPTIEVAVPEEETNGTTVSITPQEQNDIQIPDGNNSRPGNNQSITTLPYQVENSRDTNDSFDGLKDRNISASLDTITIQPGPSDGKDAFIAQEKPDDNFGSRDYFRVGCSENQYDKVSFIQFDLSSIPSGATLNSATLYLYCYETWGESQDIRVYQLGSSWNENTVTWNSAPNYFSGESTSAYISGTGWKSWDVTDHVWEWWSGQTTNYGFYLRHTTWNDEDQARFRSSDYSSSSYRPKLVVTYISPSKPDLIVQDIWTVPDEFSPGDKVDLYARIKNVGEADIPSGQSFTYKRYFDGSVVSTATRSTGLSAGSSFVTYKDDYEWPDDTNSHSIKVDVDVYEDIDESDETNNDRTEWFSAISSRLTVNVKNTPGYNLPPCGGTIKVKLWDGNNNYVGSESKTYSGGESSVQVTFDNLANGDYYFEVSQTPNAGLELEEFWGGDWVTVSGTTTTTFERHTQWLSDIKINELSPYGNDIEVDVGDAVHVDLTVKNDEAATKDVKARLLLDRSKSSSYDFDWTAGPVNIASNGNGYFGYDYSPDNTGTYYFVVIVYGYYNNKYTVVDQHEWYRAFDSITPPKSDLIVEDIWTVPSSPAGDEPCDVYFRVKNQGDRDIDDLFYNCMDIDGNSYGCWILDGLDAGSTHTWYSDDVRLCKGNHVITAEADTFDDVDESNEGNNERTESISWTGVNTKLTCHDKEAQQGHAVQLSAKLEEADIPWYDIEGRTVYFFVDGTFVETDITDSEGMAYVDYGVSLDPDSYTIEAEIYGDCKYNPCSDTATLTVTPQPKWTFMVYLDGDNNLERSYIWNFEWMEAASDNPNVNIVVQFDRIHYPDSGTDDTSYGNWSDCRRFLITPGVTPDPGNELLILGEVNMADPNTLIEFVNWAKANYPADHYLLAVVNHGGGWEPTGVQQLVGEQELEPTGIVWDATSEDYMSTADLGIALESATSGGTDKLEVVFLDACLMQMIEVEYQIKDYANYLVASENEGWAPGPYTAYLSPITSTTTPEEVANIIVNEYHNAIANPHTISAVDLNELNNLASAVDNFAQKLISGLQSYKTQIENSRSACQKFDSQGDFDIDNHDTYIDLYHFAHLIKQNIADSTIQNAAQNVLTCVDSAVIAEEHRSGEFIYKGGTYFYGLDNAHGISIYFPPFESATYYNNYNDTNLAFVADKQWDEFLNLYLDDETPTEVTNLHSTSHSTETWSKDNTINVQWTPAMDDSSGLDGYSIEWSHSSDTIPDESRDIEETVTSAISVPLSTANNWYFHIRSVDNAGNWDDTAAHLGPFYIDIDEPSIGLDSPADNAIIGGTIEERSPEPGILIGEAGEPLPVTLDWHGSDDGGSGVADYEYQICEGLNFEDYFFGHVSPPASEKQVYLYTGGHYWRVIVTDNVGYDVTSEVWSFIIDGEAPGCYYTNPEAGDHLSDPSPTFTWKFGDSSAGDPSSGLDKYVFKVGTAVDSRGEISNPIISEIFDNPQEDEGYEYTPPSPLSDGSYYWSVTAYDNMGNWHRRWTASPFVIDTNQPPTAIIDSITPDPAEQGKDTVSFTGHGTDSDGSVVAYNWRSSIDGQLSTSASFTKPAAELSVGTHTIYFEVQDNDAVWSTEDAGELTIKPATNPPSGYLDTRSGTYPSISGVHNGTITPSCNINVSNLYTYPCEGTGGHTEYAAISYSNGTVIAEAHWNGYVEDWHNISFDKTFTLVTDEEYNYTIRTGSYPQIHHTSALPTENGWINCTSFEDANGKRYNNWIPAIRLE